LRPAGGGRRSPGRQDAEPGREAGPRATGKRVAGRCGTAGAFRVATRIPLAEPRGFQSPRWRLGLPSGGWAPTRINLPGAGCRPRTASLRRRLVVLEDQAARFLGRRQGRWIGRGIEHGAEAVGRLRHRQGGHGRYDAGVGRTFRRAHLGEPAFEGGALGRGERRGAARGRPVAAWMAGGEQGREGPGVAVGSRAWRFARVWGRAGAALPGPRCRRGAGDSGPPWQPPAAQRLSSSGCTRCVNVATTDGGRSVAEARRADASASARSAARTAG